MGKLAILCLATAVSLGAAAPAGPPPLLDGSGQLRPLPRPAVILFWAAWCAPCRAEVDDIARLQEAASPLPVVVVATDASRISRRLLAHLPSARVRFPARASDQVIDMAPGGGGALPAAMALGPDGAICAEARGAVDVAMLRAWRNDCLASAEGNR